MSAPQTIGAVPQRRCSVRSLIEAIADAAAGFDAYFEDEASANADDAADLLDAIQHCARAIATALNAGETTVLVEEPARAILRRWEVELMEIHDRRHQPADV